MELSDILDEESVFYFTGISKKDDLLERISAAAAVQLGREPQPIFETLGNREALGSTGLGNGIAIPHGKLGGLNTVKALFARLETPIEFDAVDDQPVDLVMVLLAPVGAGAEHLKALSRVARLLRIEAVVDAVRATTAPSQIYGILTAPVAAHRAA